LLKSKVSAIAHSLLPRDLAIHPSIASVHHDEVSASGNRFKALARFERRDMRAENVDFFGQAQMVVVGVGVSRARLLERGHRRLRAGAELAQIFVRVAKLPDTDTVSPLHESLRVAPAGTVPLNTFAAKARKGSNINAGTATTIAKFRFIISPSILLFALTRRKPSLALRISERPSSRLAALHRNKSVFGE
jgi:hypothetical protein